MKTLLTFIFIAFACSTVNAQNKPLSEKKYEMKQYYFVMLTKGERREEITDTNKINAIQKAHLETLVVSLKWGKY